MGNCECGCGKKLVGNRQKRFSSDLCRLSYLSKCRKEGSKVKGKMHKGSIEGSYAQKMILQHLLKGPATTYQLFLASHSMSVATDVSALNANLYGRAHIECKYTGKNMHKRKIYTYTLVGV